MGRGRESGSVKGALELSMLRWNRHVGDTALAMFSTQLSGSWETEGLFEQLWTTCSLLRGKDSQRT